MRFVFVLEDDKKIQNEIAQAFLEIDKKVQLRFFSSKSEFESSQEALKLEGKVKLPELGLDLKVQGFEDLKQEEHTLNLLVVKKELFSSDPLRQIEDWQKFFSEQSLCKSEEPTACVITAFESQDFKVSTYTHKSVANIIFKPFDRLILIQHLTFALDGRHLPSKYTIQNQKADAVVEMLKTIQVEAVSQERMWTTSDRPFAVGSISKYYGEIFKNLTEKSAIGKVTNCFPHPALEGQYRVQTDFFGLDAEQVRQLRLIERKNAQESFALNKQTAEPNTNASLVWVGEDIVADKIEHEINELKKNHQFLKYKSLSDFLFHVDPKKYFTGRDKSKKFLNTAEARLMFSPGLQSFLGIEDDPDNKTQIAGKTSDSLKQMPTWLRGGISQRTFKNLTQAISNINQKFNDKPVLEWTGADGHVYFAQVNDLRTEKQHWVLNLSELSESDAADWFLQNSALPRQLRAIFIPADAILAMDEKELTELLTKFQEIPRDKSLSLHLYLYSKDKIADEKEKHLAGFFQDIFYQPLDRSYILMKLQAAIGDLGLRDPVLPSAPVKHPCEIRAANPIKVAEMSEAGFVMNYYRPISTGSFREIVLWKPYELDTPEILAQCNYSEQVPGKKEHKNHFVFFGAADSFLKSIRVWILANYVQAKKQD